MTNVNIAEIEELLECPDLIKPWLALLYGEDLSVVAAVGRDTLTEKEIGERLNLRGDELSGAVRRAYRNVALNKVAEEEDEGADMRYRLATLWLRINCIATFHPDVWHAVPGAERKKIADWHYGEYLRRKKALVATEGIDPLAVLGENGNRIVPLDQAIEYLKAQTEEIRVIPCDCKSTAERCDHERSVCFDLRHGPNTPSDRGYGKLLTLEEGVELLRKTEKMGLVHTLESHAICSCCSSCCYPLRASTALGFKGQWPKASYRIVLDASRCVNCGLCTRRCPFGVFTKTSDGTVPAVDAEKCWGCGVCASTCPKSALNLAPLESLSK